MKITYFAKNTEAVTNYNYLGAFRSLPNFSLNDFTFCDVALFSPYDEDIIDIPAFKKKFPNSLIGIVDPREKLRHSFLLKYVSFLIVDSLEMKEFWSLTGVPIFQYVEYPNLPYTFKFHENSDNFIIGYHGNKLHIESIKKPLIESLQNFALSKRVKLKLVYNKNKLGEVNFPKNIRFEVEHIQWSEKNLLDVLSKVDIGLVPMSIPVKNLSFVKWLGSSFGRIHNESISDFVIRFKMLSNPGRILVFAKSGIPVISDMTPSSVQFIKDGKTGYIATNARSYLWAFNTLSQSEKLRNELAINLKHEIKGLNFEDQNLKFLSFLKILPVNNLDYERYNNKYFDLRSKFFDFRYGLKKIVAKTISELR